MVSIDPTAPTDALPGTAEKIEVLTRRAELRLPLWHPADPRLEFDPKPRRWTIPFVVVEASDGD